MINWRERIKNSAFALLFSVIFGALAVLSFFGGYRLIKLGEGSQTSFFGVVGVILFVIGICLAVCAINCFTSVSSNLINGRDSPGFDEEVWYSCPHCSKAINPPGYKETIFCPHCGGVVKG